MWIGLFHSQDNSISISNLVTWVDYAYKMGTQKQAKMRGKNLEGQDNFEFWP